MLVDIGVPITNLTIECLDYSLCDCSIGSSLFLMSPEISMANAHEMITCKPSSSVHLGACPPCHLSKTQFFEALVAKIWDDFLPALDKLASK